MDHPGEGGQEPDGSVFRAVNGRGVVGALKATITAKFSICIATVGQTPEKRRMLLATLAASAAAMALLKTCFDDVLDVLWRMAELSLPCIAGDEYSMATVCRSATDVLVEAESAASLATHAVVQAASALKDWSVLRRQGDRVLLARR